MIYRKIPIERVVIFDEAQRAWNKEQASKFMNKKSKVKNTGEAGLEEWKLSDGTTLDEFERR